MSAPPPAPGTPLSRALRAIGLGVLYALLVVALLLLGRAGTGFIYQGF